MQNVPRSFLHSAFCIRRFLTMAHFHSCNVLHVGPDHRRVWQFDARNGGFAVNRELSAAAGEALPYALVTKTWRSLWQPKLNVAWLPADRVFLRVAHLPKSGFDETRAMVEMQLEKLSPIPVTQAVWSLLVLPASASLPRGEPQAKGDLQTVIVVLAERKLVEEFLGQLEGQGYLADRLELPMLDQLQATPAGEDGAWIYPAGIGGNNAALVAWWGNGALQNLNLLTRLGTGDAAAGFKAQLAQIVWAGELEGWLTTVPAWHLVADETIAAGWESALRQALDAPVRVVAPLAAPQLAALTAKRATEMDAKANLLPPEYAKRYQQQFQDRLWLRGLGALVGLYCTGVLIYGLALLVLYLRTHSVESQVAGLSNSYTNAMQIKARYDVLMDRQALKYAALDCWKAVADTLPNEITLDGFNFSDGHKVMLNGTAPAGSDKEILNFYGQARKVVAGDQPLFDVNKGEAIRYNTGPSGTLMWNFSLELKRAEAP
jgi:hypothetical protein